MAGKNRRIGRKIGIGILLLAIIAGAGALWARAVLQQSSRSYQAEITRTEKAYVAQLETWLNRPDDPRDSFDAQVFLSSRILEKIADTVEGQRIDFGEGRSLKIEGLRFELRKGFPLVVLSGEYEGGKEGLSFGGEVAAVLELASHEDTYILRIKPLSVRPAFGIGAIRFALSGLLGDVSQQLARDYADAWPGIELPVQTLLPIRVPPLETDVVIKIGGKEGDPWIKAVFGFPNLEADLKVVYEGLVFTEQGVHLFANLRKADQEARGNVAPSKAWQAMDVDQKLDAIGFGDNDLGSRISKRLFAFAVARIAEMPGKDRVITIRGVERSGNLVSGNAGPLYYDAWLQDPPKTTGVMRVDSVGADVSTEKTEIIRYRAKGVAEVQGQLGARVSLGKPKKSEDREKLDAAKPIGVKFAPTEVALSGRFVLTKDGDLPIIAIMIDPTEEIETRCRLKLPMIGHLTIRPKFKLPETRMTRIKLPPTFETQGEVRLGEERTPYRIAISDLVCTGGETYLTLTADASLGLGQEKTP